MTRPLTDKQQKILDFVENYWRKTGYAPSVAEVAAKLGVRKSTIHGHLLALRKKGALAHVEGQGRSWLPKSLEGCVQGNRIPLLGRVPAGPPQTAVEDVLGHIRVSGYRGGKNLYALKVQGDSMIEDGILDSDIVIVRHQSDAEDGEIVVALIDEDETTVKHLKHAGPIVWLIPANASYKPQPYPAGKVRIQGKVVGVQRHYE